MFNKNFYPTPKPLIEKLLKPYENEDYGKHRYCGKYKIEGKILDPEAGKGDILDFVSDKLDQRHRDSYYCIEIEPELQAILRDKDYILIDDDFLQYNEENYFSYIFMNPPFNNGAKHLLKAISIGDDTEIACILNAETIRNPHTKERKYLIEQLEKYGYTHEFVKDAFADAERKTSVEVVLIWLKIPAKESKFDFNFEFDKQKELNFDFEIEGNLPAVKDLIGNMQIYYDQLMTKYLDHLKAEYIFKSMHNDFGGKQDIKANRAEYAKLSKEVKKYMWKVVINKLDVEKYVTTDVRRNLDRFIEQQCNMAFSKKNVLNFIEFVINNKDSILKQTIVEVFDKLTSRGYTENRLHIETWKTNDAYKVKKKVIAPEYISYGSYQSASDLKTYGDKLSMAYSGTLDDIDKVLCYIEGYEFKWITTIRTAINRKFDEIGKIRTGDKFDSTCSSTFFNIKFYKKGTIHLTFKDEQLYQEFNYRACHGKNWLPNDEYRNWKGSPKREKEEPQFSLAHC